MTLNALPGESPAWKSPSQCVSLRSITKTIGARNGPRKEVLKWDLELGRQLAGGQEGHRPGGGGWSTASLGQAVAVQLSKLSLW